MYDDDDTSASVTSNVLRIDTKSGDVYVTPGYMTFDQTVRTPNSTHVSPSKIFDPEDASEFSYHKVLYAVNRDYICLILRPAGEHNFTEYEVYIKFRASPTIIDYDIKFTVREDDKWQYCIPPAKMGGHKGLVFMAVRVPTNGE